MAATTRSRTAQTGSGSETHSASGGKKRGRETVAAAPRKNANAKRSAESREPEGVSARAGDVTECAPIDIATGGEEGVKNMDGAMNRAAGSDRSAEALSTRATNRAAGSGAAALQQAGKAGDGRGRGDGGGRGAGGGREASDTAEELKRWMEARFTRAMTRRAAAMQQAASGVATRDGTRGGDTCEGATAEVVGADASSTDDSSGVLEEDTVPEEPAQQAESEALAERGGQGGTYARVERVHEEGEGGEGAGLDGVPRAEGLDAVGGGACTEGDGGEGNAGGRRCRDALAGADMAHDCAAAEAVGADAVGMRGRTGMHDSAGGGAEAHPRAEGAAMAGAGGRWRNSPASMEWAQPTWERGHRREQHRRQQWSAGGGYRPGGTGATGGKRGAGGKGWSGGHVCEGGASARGGGGWRGRWVGRCATCGGARRGRGGACTEGDGGEGNAGGRHCRDALAGADMAHDCAAAEAVGADAVGMRGRTGMHDSAGGGAEAHPRAEGAAMAGAGGRWRNSPASMEWAQPTWERGQSSGGRGEAHGGGADGG
ncbi:unnamed protein product [Closterium sp. NIES-53]